MKFLVKWWNSDSRIKNMPKKRIKRDFSYNAMSFLLMTFFIFGGLISEIIFGYELDYESAAILVGGAFLGSIILFIFPFWGLVMTLLLVGGVTGLMYEHYFLLLGCVVGLLLSCSLQQVFQWDKIVILRAGKFHKVRGPGLFFILPILDRTAAYVDTRIRVTDFSAEKTLTCDTVPVHVDAICFWMIWDAKKAVLEVENYMEAVALSAQTALRDAIGRHDLADLLSKREAMGQEIQRILDHKTNPWGITILSVEFTDITIPKELEDSMSLEAQAIREKKSRVILSEAEIEVAKNFEIAAGKYNENETAIKLRSMNIVYEGLKKKEGSIMVLPSSALDQMNLGTTMGMAALQKEEKAEKNAKKIKNLSKDKEA